ncbi:hypothetical protein BN7_6169 [Wickerhamomyces ciferrii]|uniref:Uncharacterized protein n=1 Tax=Wickerhamomyces ciferrii (strain ATCC 14091 / BCRC 22168 / CBS 111 / JCM 3599 / NBRC 0793 / NRRL Y-1031 F-60-10) TaxID=1206466 RepID=K0KTR7_WICCF|nr:uncharacterized protein BN7_6169 [Wickerhamomyces ciferrii]CCH46576.1 hypothetical protein BN7_6169 [Wickerhamomyces ciferrii]
MDNVKFSIVLNDVDLKIKNVDKDEDDYSRQDEYKSFLNQDPGELDPNTPLHIFPQNFIIKSLIELYLLYFRFVGFKFSNLSINFEKLGLITNIDHIFTEIKVNRSKKKRNFGATLRLFHQSINGIEIFDAFTIGCNGALDFKTGELSKINLDVEMRNLSIPILSIIKTLPKKTKHKKQQWEPESDEFCSYSLAKMNKKLYIFCYFIKLIEKIDVAFQNMSINEIPLGDMEQIQSSNYEPLVKFELKINAFALTCQRMYFDSPGYGLTYTYEDKPFHLIYNFTEICFAMQSPKQDEYKPILTVPVMNFTGSSNVYFQTLEASKNNTHSDGKLLITGHLSDLILDLSSDDVANIVLAALDFLKVKKEFLFKQGVPTSSETSNSKVRSMFWFGAFPKLWPKFDVKLSIENPIILVKNPILDQFYRILVLRFALVSVQFRTEKTVDQDDNINFSASQIINLSNAKIKFRNTHEKIDVEVLKLEGIDLKQTINILPQLLVTTSLISNSTILDASDINVLHGINSLMSDLYWKIRPLVDQFKLDTGGYCLPESKPPVSQPKTSKSNDYIGEESFDDIIPPWLSHVVFISNNTEVLLGSRSLLIPKELVKNIDPLSENDLINGDLRKVGFSIEKWTIGFISQAAKTDYDSSTSSPSSLEDDDKGLLDSLAENESLKDSWNLKIESSHIVGKIHSESSHKNNKLVEKSFMKIPSSVLTVNPNPDNNSVLMIDFSLGKVDMFYSVITHFIIISSFHLLRNTVLEFFQYKKNPEVEAIPSCGPPKKKKSAKDILDKIQFTFNIDYLELIFVFPDRLKLRLEFNKLNALSLSNKPILINSHYLRICAESPTTAGYWARILTAVNGSTTVNIEDILNKDIEKVWFDLSNESCHLIIPHQFIIYKVFDNISVSIKTLKQLHYSLKNNTDEIIINPHAKPAEKIPRTRLKSSRLFFSMDDDPFEAELNMIFQVGLSEQKMRYEKTKLFDARLREEIQNNRQRSTKSNTFPVNFISNDVHSDLPTLSKRKKFQKFKPPTFSSIHHAASMDAIFSNGKQNGSENDSNNQQQQQQSLNFHKMFDAKEKALEKLYKLREGFSKSWIARIRAFKKNQEREFQQNFKFLWGNLDLSRLSEDFNRKVLDFVTAPSLFSLILEGVDLKIGPPSYGYEKIPDFLHDVGKGKPKDSEYSTLIPIHMDLRLDELRCHLRDYPLPFIYMPKVKGPESGTLPAVQIHGDIVIGENTIKSHKEVREVFVPLVPGCNEFDKDDRYSIEIPKTLTSIKFYTMLDLDLNSSDTTKVTWGTSYQPCIQQIMLNLDNFTKPPIDPSDKVGFWDKIRANFHARMKLNWNRGGRFDVLFKGTKNPYDICGKAAGFILGFKDDVVVNINEKDDPREFLATTAQELIFAVPNHIAEPLLVWSRETEKSVFLANQNTNYQSSTYGFYFGNDEIPDEAEVEIMTEHYLEKVAIRLSGGVKFNLALAFERKTDDGNDRTSNFISHDEITLVNPKYVEDRDAYDAYHHFRSHFIHMGITLISESDIAYNTIQLTPATFQHFFAFWRMFSNTFPVRHGKLFGPEKPTKKFARHLFTIKYKAIANPLFISHVYHDHESDSQDQDKFASVGMKARASQFTLDLHQRKELSYEHNQQLGVTKKIMKMGFNSGSISMSDLDLRTIHGKFELNKDLTMAKRRASGYKMEDNHEVEVMDGDKSWFDIHDFTEIGTATLDGFKSKVMIHPLMYTPSFMYYKKNDHGDKYQINFDTGKRTRPFGDESFHECLVHENNSAIVQQESLAERLEQLRSKRNEKVQDIEKLNNVSSHTPEIRRQIDQMRIEIKRLEHGLKFVQDIALAYQSRSPDDIVENSSFDFFVNDDFDKSPFKNKFIIHNMLLKWNDSNRDVVYKYVYLFELRQEISRYMQHRSMGQIDDIIETQERRANGTGVSRSGTHVTQATYESQNGVDNDHGHGYSKSIAETRASEKLKNFEDELYNLSFDLSCIVQENFLLKFITPQIQLQSESNKNSAVLVVSPNIELKVLAFDVNETDNEYHENIIEKRFGAILTDASAFVFYADDKTIRDNLFFSNSTYGSEKAWPPWLGVELCYDGSALKNNMLIEKNSIIVRYDKPDDSFFANERDNSINKLSCDLSEAIFRCDARQYYSLYNMIMNLLIYNEPRNQKLKEREAKMLLRLDVNDISNLKDRIVSLQDSIRQMTMIQNNLNGRRTILDDVERNDLLVVTNQKADAVIEVYLLMRVALMGGRQSKTSDDYLEWNIRADDIKLHMLDEDRLPFLDAILTNSHFKRVEGSDRSDSNFVSIERVELLNLEDRAELPILFAPYDIHKKSYKQHPKGKNSKSKEKSKPMIQVSWRMDNPVGGIRVIRRFEVELEPLELNIDQRLGDKVMKYAFPDESPLLLRNTVDNPDHENVHDNVNGNNNTNVNGKKDESMIDGDDLVDEIDVNRENLGVSNGNKTNGNNNNPNNLPSIAVDASSTFRSDYNVPKQEQQQVSPRRSFFSFRSRDEESFHNSQSSQHGSSIFDPSALSHQNNHTSTTAPLNDVFEENDEDDDELEEMVRRASNYLSIVSFRFKSCLVSITYRGHGAKRLINVSDFAFTLPEIIFTNKTWTLLDLTMAIKKLVIKALLSHSGSIIGNKLVQHKRKRVDGLRDIGDYASSRISSFRSN